MFFLPFLKYRQKLSVNIFQQTLVGFNDNASMGHLVPGSYGTMYWTGGCLTENQLIEIVFYQLIEIFIIS